MSRRTKPAATVTRPLTVAAAPLAAVSDTGRQWLIAVGLIAVTFAVYYPALKCQFVNFDDNEYVVDNSQLKLGLTFAGVRWAFTSVVSANWHPLTMISLLIDHDLFGDDPWGYHLVNVLLHLANTLLLFRCLCVLTGAVWRSAVVSALFALHPLHVESVAWVSERKDVLSTFFGLLALRAYVWYVAGEGNDPMNRVTTNVRSDPIHRVNIRLRMTLVAALLALSLLAKPMWVTFPFLLLLLDYWPLRRLDRGTWRRPILEKLPLFAVVILFCVTTLLTQIWHPGIVAAAGRIPLPYRAANAVVSYVQYLRQTFLPNDLAVLYPHPGAALPGWELTVSVLIVVGISALSGVFVRSLPYLFVGWWWYVGMLVPVIGLVQVGEQARADRYTYVPLVGVFIVLTWGAADLLKRTGQAFVAPLLAAVVLIVFGVHTWSHVGVWRNSLTLWEHAVGVTTGNAQAHLNYGAELLKADRNFDALKQYDEYLALRPNYARALEGRGHALARLGMTEEAVEAYREAIRLDRDVPFAHYNLGLIAFERGQLEVAAKHFQDCVEFAPRYALAWYNLGRVRLVQKNYAGALSALLEVERLDPGLEDSELHLADTFAGIGRFGDATAVIDRALAERAGGHSAALVQALRDRRRCYEKGQPYRPQ